MSDLFRFIHPLRPTFDRRDFSLVPHPYYDLLPPGVSRYEWSPITGCKFGCDYCSFRLASKDNGIGFEPRFHSEELSAPSNTLKLLGRKPFGPIMERAVSLPIFGEMFGPWVPRGWIEAVLQTVRKSPEFVFVFITKAPERLVEFEWPDNAWLCVTVDTQSRVRPAEKAFERIQATVKAIFCMPMLERLTFTRPDLFDWVVVSALGLRVKNRIPPFRLIQPQVEWVDRVTTQAKEAGCKVCYMPTLLAFSQGCYEWPFMEQDLADPQIKLLIADSIQYWGQEYKNRIYRIKPG